VFFILLQPFIFTFHLHHLQLVRFLLPQQHYGPNQIVYFWTACTSNHGQLAVSP